MPTKRHPLTPARYLASVPADQRPALTAAYRVVHDAMPDGFAEGMQWGIVSWYVPDAILSGTYNGQPLTYAALGAKKNYCTLHLMGAYGNAGLAARLRDGFRAAGKKLDMGKACIRFRTADDLALEVITGVVAAVPMRKYVELYHQSRRLTGSGRRDAARRAKKAAPAKRRTTAGAKPARRRTGG
ncbi:MAG: DUF1801 domain-containing protein [Gemmatimonadales bacterium]